MKKSSFAARFTCLAVFALLPTLGCGDGAAAKIENVPVNDQVWGDQPVDPLRVVDSQDSWRKFLAEAKQPGRMKLAEKQFVDLRGPAASLKIVFMKDEMEYAKFGDKAPFKGIDPNRFYEVGVVTLAAKEHWGSDGYQIREYVLKFITPRRDGDWRFVFGTYHVSKFSGSMAADPAALGFVSEKEYQGGHLRPLFVKPLPVAKPAAAAPVSQGGEQPVETKIQP